MPTRPPDRPEDENPNPANRYAAKILRDLDERIDRLENAVTSEGVPNVIRSVTEQVTIGDATNTIVDTVVDPRLRWDAATTGGATGSAIDLTPDDSWLDAATQIFLTPPSTVTWWAKLFRIGDSGNFLAPGVISDSATGGFDDYITYARADTTAGALTSGTANVVFRVEDTVDNLYTSPSFSYDLDTNPAIFNTMTIDASGVVEFKIDDVSLGTGGSLTSDISMNDIGTGYGGSAFDGKGGKYFDDFRIYDDKLTDAELSDLFAGNDVTRQLIHHWPFDDQDLVATTDVVGGNDATLNNTSNYVTGFKAGTGTATESTWDQVGAAWA